MCMHGRNSEVPVLAFLWTDSFDYTLLRESWNTPDNARKAKKTESDGAPETWLMAPYQVPGTRTVPYRTAAR